MADQKHLEILWQGFEVWNKWREENPDITAILREADLQGANLQKADLQGADLQGANLQRVGLQGANLQRTDLRGANLQRAGLQGADLRKANLREADFRGANLQGADLQKADLHEVKTDINNSSNFLSFTDLFINEAAEDGYILLQTHFGILKQGPDTWNKWREDNPEVKPELQVANLWGASLRRANLRETDLRRANLRETDLRRADLQKANLQKADLQGADLREADLTEADFEGANLERADLQLANIQRVYLQDANLKFLRIRPESLSYIPDHIRQQYEKTWLVPSQVRKEDTEKLIIRSIEFPPEYHQAGISILNYFSTVLRNKYPDVKATVQIKQEDLKVTMTIDPVEGDREVIEKALDEYGLVVTGKMTPEEYCGNDPLQTMELKTQLSIAQVQIDSQKQIIAYQEKESGKKDSQIEKKDIQVDRLLTLLESGLKSDSEKKEQSEISEKTRVFISCAEDDILTANKIYADLQKKGIIPWTHKNINPGEKTKFAVKRAMEESDYFLALLSTSSMNERGAFQKELKQAFDILAEFP
ncbi:MAG: TIR domain-containing protein, partial [Desulfobacteraceae bacterium]|nr:TIR domain-containing protein [Desulfobacteraceae bacterium]